VISVITFTGTGDHFQPVWLITFTGMRTEARQLREDVGGRIGEALAQTVPYVSFRGVLVDEAVAMWTRENDRIWSQPWQPPVPRASRRTRRRWHHRFSVPAASRVLHRNVLEQGSDKVLVRFCRSGIELTGRVDEARGCGDASKIGDVCAVDLRIAEALVKKAAADYVTEASNVH
jgi:hypothetical protein